jgi:hypothetical protein
VAEYRLHIRRPATNVHADGRRANFPTSGNTLTGGSENALAHS